MERHHASKKLFIALTLKYIYYSFMRSEIYKMLALKAAAGGAAQSPL